MIKDLEMKIAHLEDLIQAISSEILANIASERLPPAELWALSEADVNAITDLAEEISNTLLFLKPEKAPSIKRRLRTFIQPLNSFKETLQESRSAIEASRQALEHLRKSVTESQEFINIAKEIAKKPSEGILEILKLREVYEAKEYISKVSVPEAVYMKIEHLKKSMEALKFRISNLEEAIKDLLEQMEKFQEATSVFQKEQQQQI